MKKLNEQKKGGGGIPVNIIKNKMCPWWVTTSSSTMTILKATEGIKNRYFRTDVAF